MIGWHKTPSECSRQVCLVKQRRRIGPQPWKPKGLGEPQLLLSPNTSSNISKVKSEPCSKEHALAHQLQTLSKVAVVILEDPWFPPSSPLSQASEPQRRNQTEPASYSCSWHCLCVIHKPPTFSCCVSAHEIPLLQTLVREISWMHC